VAPRGPLLGMTFTLSESSIVDPGASVRVGVFADRLADARSLAGAAWGAVLHMLTDRARGGGVRSRRHWPRRGGERSCMHPATTSRWRTAGEVAT
jgi:hypothetical protein